MPGVPGPPRGALHAPLAALHTYVERPQSVRQQTIPAQDTFYEVCRGYSRGELKADGRRAQIHFARATGIISVYNKRGLEVSAVASWSWLRTNDFRALVAAALPAADSYIFDCEIVPMNPNQPYPYNHGARRDHYRAQRGENGLRLGLYIFDLMLLNGISRTREPLMDRRTALQDAITHEEPRVRISKMYPQLHSAQDLRDVLDEVRAEGYEGVVLKCVSHRYWRRVRWKKIRLRYIWPDIGQDDSSPSPEAE